MGEIIPKGSLVLVTGASGLLGSHVVDQALSVGYKVRGVTRNAQENAWLDDYFEKKYGKGKYETVQVPDMKAEGCYDQVTKGCSAVIAVASVMSMSPDPNDVIPTTVAGVLNVASAAAKELSVKRVVFTSSSASIWTPRPNEEITFDQNSWNEIDIEKAWAPPPYTPDRAMIVYAASKTLAEQEFWRFMKEEKPHFALTTVLPDTLLGEILYPEVQTKHFMTAALPRMIYNGMLNQVKDLIPPHYFVAVEDTARLHVAGLTRSDTANERIFAYARPYNFNSILAELRKLYPEKNFDDDIESLGWDLSKVPNDRAEQILKDGWGDGWVSFEETIRRSMIGVGDLP